VIVPGVAGAHAGVAGARDFADAVVALLERYTREVVAALALCPHLRDVDTGLGAVCVVVDRALDVDVAVRAVRDTGASVVHLVYPLADVPAGAFERFGSAVAARLAGDGGSRLVHAAFHPAMIGSGDAASQLVALARRAPDAMLQFVPAEVAQRGGGVARRQPVPLDVLAARIEALHAARRAVVAPAIASAS
jgi:hypothetical protein